MTRRIVDEQAADLREQLAVAADAGQRTPSPQAGVASGRRRPPPRPSARPVAEGGGSSGLVRYSSMPAARQRSRSPFIACAVIATIGMRRRRCALALANRRGRLEAAHLRHLHVHQHDVEALASSASTASRPLSAIVDLMPAPLEQAAASRWLTALSSARSTCRRRSGSSPAASPAAAPRAGRALARARGRSRRAGRADRPAWSDAARCPTSRHFAISSYCPDELSIMIVGGQLRFAADPPRDLEAVHVGHVRVEQDERERAARARSPRAAPRSAAAPLSTTVGRIFQRSSRSCRMRRFTALSSTISTGRPVRLTRGRLRPRLGEAETRR